MARSHPARSLTLALGFAIGCGNAAALAGTDVHATRVWPARDYTRLTLESKGEFRFELFSLKGPERLVLELQDAELSSAIAELPRKISQSDPYIADLRVARNRPGVVRIVLDLKSEVNPQIFTLKPIADYGHRLVIDLHPAVETDPLITLLARSGARPAAPGSTPSVPKGSPLRAGETTHLATVAIDAGHGGEDPGAKGRRGTLEKDVTLLIAQRLKSLVDLDPNMRGILTRDGDYYLPLYNRVDKARKVRADLFVSIHADSFMRRQARGSSVYALSLRRATSVAAQKLADRENQADLIGGVHMPVGDPHVRRTLFDLSQAGSIDHSLKAGSAVLNALGGVNTLHKRNVEQASFAVLTAHDVPSILVETAFISNPDEEKKLGNPAYQEKLARAIFSGIKRYFAANPPRGAPVLATVNP